MHNHNLSRCSKLIFNISRLLEANMTGKYCINTSIPIEDIEKERLFYKRRFYDFDTYDEYDDYECLTLSLSKSIYTNYKKGLAIYSSPSPRYNYIYKYSQNIKALNLDDENEINTAIRQNVISTKKCTLEQIYKYIKNSKTYNHYPALENWINYPEFIKRYNGIMLDDTIYLFFNEKDIDTIINNLKLIDGNTIRFDISNNYNIKLPRYVLDDLIKYTDKADTKLTKRTTEWLKKNFKKPYSEITLYRGSSLDLYTIAENLNYSPENIPIDTIEHYLNSWFGIKRLEDIKKGNPAIVKRRKESSWSTVPQIARATANEVGINFLFKATIPSDKILIDFSLIPEQILKKEFEYWTQNEVIVDNYEIEVTIADVWITDSKTVKDWMKNNNISFLSKHFLI